MECLLLSFRSWIKEEVKRSLPLEIEDVFCEYWLIQITEELQKIQSIVK